jgi:hypothetical protein
MDQQDESVDGGWSGGVLMDGWTHVWFWVGGNIERAHTAPSHLCL